MGGNYLYSNPFCIEVLVKMNLIIGQGLIGRGLYYRMRGNAIFTTRKEIDLSCNEWEIPEHDTSYICAGVTSTSECNRDPEGTYLVNVLNTVRLAERLNRPVWFSSERVFDGSKPFRKPYEEHCPTTEYGRQKSEAEQLLDCVKVRFAKVIGWDVPLFEDWIRKLRKQEVIYPFSNMSMSPIPIEFACKFAEKASELRSGLYQVSAKEDLPYDRIAYFIASYIGADMRLVRPVEAEEGHPYTTLDDDGLTRSLGMNIPNAWDTIYNWCKNKCL